MSDNQLRKLESTEVTPMIKALVEMQSRFNSSTFHLDAFSQAAHVAEQLDVLMVALDNLRQSLRRSEARQRQVDRVLVDADTAERLGGSIPKLDLSGGREKIVPMSKRL